MKHIYAVLILLLASTYAVGSYIGVAKSPAGVIFPFGGSTCPSGSILANGQSLLRAGTYKNLFTAIGTTWGSVDGTHFTLPPLAGRFLRGIGSPTDGNGGDSVTIGAYQTDSTKRPTISFTTDSQGAHTHTIPLQNSGDTVNIPGSLGIFRASGTTATSSDGAHTHTITGGGDSETRPKAYGVTYCIWF